MKSRAAIAAEGRPTYGVYKLTQHGRWERDRWWVAGSWKHYEVMRDANHPAMVVRYVGQPPRSLFMINWRKDNGTT